MLVNNAIKRNAKKEEKNCRKKIMHMSERARERETERSADRTSVCTHYQLIHSFRIFAMARASERESLLLCRADQIFGCFTFSYLPSPFVWFRRKLCVRSWLLIHKQCILKYTKKIDFLARSFSSVFLPYLQCT
jgi:hypothetical protein